MSPADGDSSARTLEAIRHPANSRYLDEPVNQSNFLPLPGDLTPGLDGPVRAPSLVLPFQRPPSYDASGAVISNRAWGPGIVIGKDRHCDIVLPKFRGVSARHCILTFDDKGRFVVQDLGSTYGTGVIYITRRSGGEFSYGNTTYVRKHIKWILDGPAVYDMVRTIVLEITREIKFKLQVYPFDFTEERKRVFHGGLTTAQIRDAIMHLQNPHSLVTPPVVPISKLENIEVREPIGRGGFAEVLRVWNTNNGHEYALKRRRRGHSHSFDLRQWQREARILREAKGCVSCETLPSGLPTCSGRLT